MIYTAESTRLLKREVWTGYLFAINQITTIAASIFFNFGSALSWQSVHLIAPAFGQRYHFLPQTTSIDLA
jgi:hypothetical protein